ncbi:MAG: hypothetical protein Q9195_000624 [Heterodermia aff. obscurata]
MKEKYTARKQFLDDLDNYVPLGSIYAFVLDDSFVGDSWEEQPPEGMIRISYQNPRVAQQLGILLQVGMVRLFTKRLPKPNTACVTRVYALSDDVGRRWKDREIESDRVYRKVLNTLMESIIDFSAEGWAGNYSKIDQRRYLRDRWWNPDRDELLFYTFNTLSSPTPDDNFVACIFSSNAMATLLDTNHAVAGLNTLLYPYQRRSAATMVRREAEPAPILDPRLEALEGPVGNTFYYDRQTKLLLRDKRTYEEPRGGILAETMGLGKTLICLAVILATKGHWPRVPPEYSTNLYPIRHKVGKLMDMAAAAIARQQVPWRVYFQNLAETGQHNQSCVSILEKNVGSYVIVPRLTKRTRRPSLVLKEQTIRLCPVTLVVVPLNLFHHWQNEMASHVSKDALKVIFVRTMQCPMPSEDEIIVSDVILIIKPRFEREMKPPDSTYESPLKKVHFLRIIVDEGHDFGSASAGTNAIFALQKLHVDRRWIISGTPTTGLLGVEVGLAAEETAEGNNRTASASLVKNRTGATQERVQESKDLERLGRIVKDFFQLRPWANSKGDDAASWHDYIMPDKNGSRKLRSLRSILESLVVRHRLEDVERDIRLPPLHNRIVTIEPTWHDKLSLNLFLLNLCINAVTSERVDQDYMFHPKNSGKLNVLIGNLRQAGFYWTAHEPVEISKALKFGEKYLQKRMLSDSPVEDTDKELLNQASFVGDAALISDTWKCLSELNELGVYVEEFPTDTRKAWSLVDTDGHSEPLLVAATHLAEAQKTVDSRFYTPNPADDLVEVGRRVLQSARDDATKRKYGKASLTSLADEPKLLTKDTISHSKAGQSPKKKRKVSDKRANEQLPATDRLPHGSNSAPNSDSDCHQPFGTAVDFQPAETKICGFASAKLTYLVDRVLALQQTEKIIVFYEGNNIAYYIAQALDLIDVRYLIYTGSLPERRKAAYITTFNTTENFRVMLMDLSQAAHGLHVASASRVFFVNPVWQPMVEAQAIKRAHRIGQTKPVYVETLVLQNTLEDEMRLRRKSMSLEEARLAEKSPLDDNVMSDLIKNAKFLPMALEQHQDSRPYARLKEPQQLFGRAGSDERTLRDPDADLVFPGDELAPRQGVVPPPPEPAPPVSEPRPRRLQKKTVRFASDSETGD